MRISWGAGQGMNIDDRDKLDHLEYIWEKYVFSGDPNYLASYLELGGEFDDQVCREVCRILRDGHPSKKGERNTIRDVEVYMAIKDIRFDEAIESFCRESSGGDKTSRVSPTDTSATASPKPKRMTLQIARETYIKKLENSVEDDTIRKQYERGRRILGGKKRKIRPTPNP
jgi:hypothetical protein